MGVAVDGSASVGGGGGVGGGGVYAAQSDGEFASGRAVGPTDSPGNDSSIGEGIEPEEGVVGGVVGVCAEADFKVEMGAVGDAAGAGEGDYLFGLNGLTDGDQDFGEVAVEVEDGLSGQGGIELNDDDVAVEVGCFAQEGGVVSPGKDDGAAGGGQDFGSGGDVEFDAVMGP